jgi:hypothetical protein
LSFGGLSSKWSNKKELFEFIRDPEEARKSNAYVKDLVESFGGVEMRGSPNLTDDDIQAILDYIDEEQKNYPTLVD